jgi:hypothetical protein
MIIVDKPRNDTMSMYTDILKRARQLPRAEQQQLRRALAEQPEDDQKASPASALTTHPDLMLACIGSVDEEPVTTDELD